MPINKFNSYAVFIGPCLNSGFSSINYSGLFSYGGPKAIQNNFTFYTGARFLPSNFANAGVGSIEQVFLNNEAVLKVESTSPGTNQCGADILRYPASGYIRMYGEIYIPSTNVTATRASVTLGNTVLIASGYNRWNPVFCYFRNENVSNNPFQLALRDGNTANDNQGSPTFGVSDGDLAYFRNLAVIIESGQVPFTGDTHINLLQNLDLVQNVGLEINENITDLKEIGRPQMIDRQNLFYQDGNLSISYLQHSLENELKFGFNVNHPDILFNQGRAKFNNYNYDVLCNLTGNSITGFSSGYLYPLANNKYKNFYISITDLEDNNNKNYSTGHTDPHSESQTLAIGNAYLKSYRVAGSVNTVPLATVSYTFFNLTEQPKDYGYIPSIYPESGNYHTGQYYLLPNIKDKDYAVILPRNVQISLSGLNSFANLTGCLWREFDFSIDFNTKQNERLGWHIPDSCDIQTPNKISIRLEGLVEDHDMYQLRSLKNSPSNLSISYFGCTGNSLAEKIRYDFRGCKIDNIQTNYSVSNLNSITVSLTQELSFPLNGNGFFMSGILWQNPTNISKTVALKNKDYAIDFIAMSGNNIWLYGN